MRKFFFFVIPIVAVGVAYFLYARVFSTQITLTDVFVPNVSFKYKNVPQAGISVVFINQDTGSSYVAASRMSVSGETTVMIPTGVPQGVYSIRIQNNQTLKKLAESGTFIVGPGAKPIVKIDKNTLISSTHHPILSGIAQNISDISILVEDSSQRRYFGGEVDVFPANGGAWSITLTEMSLPNGMYVVRVFNSRDDSQGALANETLVVSAE